MEFKGILILLIVSGTLSILILGTSYLLGYKQPDIKKCQSMSVDLILLTTRGIPSPLDSS